MNQSNALSSEPACECTVVFMYYRREGGRKVQNYRCIHLILRVSILVLRNLL